MRDGVASKLFISLLITGVVCIVASGGIGVWLALRLTQGETLLDPEFKKHIYYLAAHLGTFGMLFIAAYSLRSRITTYLRRTDFKVVTVHILVVFVALDILIVLLHILSQYFALPGNQYFYLDEEYNLPSIYSALQLILVGGAAFYCSRLRSERYIKFFPEKYIWIFVGVMLFALGVDEFVTWHEGTNLIQSIGLMSPDSDPRLGGYGYDWTLGALLLVIVFGLPGLFLFKKVFRDYPHLLYLLILSSVLFVLGAVGFENLQVYRKSFQSVKVAPVLLILEEFLEMLGVTLALFVILRYSALVGGESNLVNETGG